ncbi:MAG: ATP synthase subunit I [Deltaproteobacteria bacterium]|nr:ATP synthase subunit I [Deltaproteobacteria bacterium]
MEWENISEYLKTFNWLILLLLSLISFCVMNERFTLGIILGGMMSIANFRLLQKNIRKGFLFNKVINGNVLKINRAGIIFKFYLRLTVLGILIYFLITRQVVNPIGLTIGLSIIVMSIICLGINLIRKRSSGEAV